MTDQTPPCPTCGSNKLVYADGPRNFFCRLCSVTFDDDPDEGGTHGNDPARTAERNEEFEARERGRRERRRR